MDTLTYTHTYIQKIFLQNKAVIPQVKKRSYMLIWLYILFDKDKGWMTVKGDSLLLSLARVRLLHDYVYIHNITLRSIGAERL